MKEIKLSNNEKQTITNIYKNDVVYLNTAEEFFEVLYNLKAERNRKAKEIIYGNLPTPTAPTSDNKNFIDY